MLSLDVTSVFDRFGQFAFMALIILGNQVMARRAQDRKLRAEIRRVRSAICIGMRALHTLYENNLQHLKAERRVLTSGRQQILLLRTQLTRLLVLENVEIEFVLAASIAVEAVETEIAVIGKPLNGVAFTLPDDSVAFEAVRLPLLSACEALEVAETALASNI